MDSPECIVIPLFIADVPSAGVIGLDSDDRGPILLRAFDVEELPVVNVLESPTPSSRLDPPLRGEIRIVHSKETKGGEEGTNLLVVAPLFGEADYGLTILTREVTNGSSLFVDKNVSRSRSNVDHDVR